MMQIADRQFEAYQASCSAASCYWTGEHLPRADAIYTTARPTRRQAARRRAAPRIPRRCCEGEPLYAQLRLARAPPAALQVFRSLGAAPAHARAAPSSRPSSTRGRPPAMLELDPALEMPRYYTAVDIHQHPGGVWRDALAGFVYERGARTTTPLLDARTATCTTASPTCVREQRRAPPRRSTWAAASARARGRSGTSAARRRGRRRRPRPRRACKLAARDAAAAQARNVRFRQARLRAHRARRWQLRPRDLDDADPRDAAAGDPRRASRRARACWSRAGR